MSSQSSIKRLKLCSLARLKKMSATLSGEITTLNERIEKMEDECTKLAIDEGTVDSEGVGREMERLAVKMGGTVKWPGREEQRSI